MAFTCTIYIFGYTLKYIIWTYLQHQNKKNKNACTVLEVKIFMDVCVWIYRWMDGWMDGTMDGTKDKQNEIIIV